MGVFSFFKKFAPEGRDAGFTLAEMLIVLTITVLLSATIIANINTGDRGVQVRRSAQLVLATLREAQNDALGAKRAGVYFVLSQNPILFIDQDADNLYDVGEEVRTIALDTDVFISSLVPVGPLHIFFSPPNPDVYINGSPIVSDALIVIQSLDDGAVTRTVRVNILGLITIE